MPRSGLIAAYRQKLVEGGLSLADFREESWLKILKAQHSATAYRVNDLPEADDDFLRAGAQEMAENGGCWNTRLQRLVPSVIDATKLCIQSVEEALGRQLPIPDPDDIFIGEYPTGDYNASVERVEAGYLVLMNTGLPETLYQLCTLLTEARDWPIDEVEQERRVEHAAKMATAITRKYREGACFLVLKSRSGRSRETAMDLHLTELTFESILVFIVAHEIAHVILGHCNPGRSSSTFGARRIARVNSRCWQEELSADTLGTMILETWCRGTPGSKGVAGTLLASMLSFELERVMRAAGRGEKNDYRPSGTHPPAALRQRYTIEVLLKLSEAHKELLEDTRHYRGFLRRLRNRIDEWRLAGTLDTVVEVDMGGVEELKRHLLEMPNNPAARSMTIMIDATALTLLEMEALNRA